MFNAFATLLCSKLCWHNRRKPITEQAHFTPLIFTTGGMAASQKYKRLASLLAEKLDLSFGEIMR